MASKYINAFTLQCEGSEGVELQGEVLDLVRCSKLIRDFVHANLGPVIRIPAQFSVEVVACFLDIVRRKQEEGTFEDERVPKTIFVPLVIFGDYLQAEPALLDMLRQSRGALAALKTDIELVTQQPPELWGIKLAQKLFDSARSAEDKAQVLSWIVRGPESFFKGFASGRGYDYYRRKFFPSDLSPFNAVTKIIKQAGAVGKVHPWQLIPMDTPRCLMWLKTLELMESRCDIGSTRGVPELTTIEGPTQFLTRTYEKDTGLLGDLLPLPQIGFDYWQGWVVHIYDDKTFDIEYRDDWPVFGVYLECSIAVLCAHCV